MKATVRAKRKAAARVHRLDENDDGDYIACGAIREGCKVWVTRVWSDVTCKLCLRRKP